MSPVEIVNGSSASTPLSTDMSAKESSNANLYVATNEPSPSSLWMFVRNAICRSGLGSDMIASPVLGFGRDHPPNAATRVGNIAVATRYHVDVRVHHGLPSGAPIVDPDIEAQRPESFEEKPTDNSNMVPKCSLLVRCEIVNGLNMSPRHDQRVAFRDGVPVEDRQAVGRLMQDAIWGRMAERAFAQRVHANGITESVARPRARRWPNGSGSACAAI